MLQGLEGATRGLPCSGFWGTSRTGLPEFERGVGQGIKQGQAETYQDRLRVDWPSAIRVPYTQ